MSAARLASVCLLCVLCGIRPALAVGQPTRVVLPNGLTVLTSEGNGSGVVAIAAMVRISALDEPPESLGVRNFTHQVIARGSAQYSGDQITAALEAVGGKLSLSVSADCAELQAVTLCDGFELSLRFIADLLRRPRFDAHETESVRVAILSQLAAPPADDWEAAYLAFKRTLYADTPYAWEIAGKPEAVRALTREQLVAFHSRHYLPNNTVLAIVGGLPPERVLDGVTRSFGGWEKQSLPERVMPSLAALSLGRMIPLETPRREGTVMVGFPAPAANDGDFAPMSALNSLLGSGMGSRLFREIRERTGLAYQATSICPTLLGPGHLVAYAGTDPTKVSAVRDAILRECTRLQREPVTDGELEAAKRFLLGNNARAHGHNREQAYYLSWYEALGVGYELDSRYPALIERVTAQDVMRVANRYLRLPVIVDTETPAKGEQPKGRE
jgi:zinc protease